jgi:hypothetical protein
MFDAALKKAEEAVTRMNKSLTVFEKESEALRVKFLEDLVDLQEKADQKIKDSKVEIGKIYAEYSREIETLFLEYKNKLSVLAVADLEYFSQEVKKRFESLYLEHEQEAKKKIMQLFETDIKAIFTTYGDLLAPIFFKFLLRYIFPVRKIVNLFRKKKS